MAHKQGIDVRLGGRLGNFTLDVDFSIPGQGVTALFGPSGCGKTSVLRCIAGLQHLPGEIRVNGEAWQNAKCFVPPHKRTIGYVFQEASLFQHLSVRKNLTYGEQRCRTERRIRFDDVVDLLGLAHLVDRHPQHLSGGERQRVSIGRALLSQPRLLLMDEPLSALDRMAKDEILPYLENLHASLSIPMILVSHDISEVERLADHLLLLEQGRVQSSGPLNQLLTDPGLSFGRSRDSAAVLSGRVLRTEEDGIVVLDVLGSEFLLTGGNLQSGAAVRVRIAASDVSIAKEQPGASSILNLLPARVRSIEPLGTAEVLLRLSLDGSQGFDFMARLSRRSLARLELHEGDAVIAQIKAVSVLATG